MPIAGIGGKAKIIGTQASVTGMPHGQERALTGERRPKTYAEEWCGECGKDLEKTPPYYETEAKLPKLERNERLPTTPKPCHTIIPPSR